MNQPLIKKYLPHLVAIIVFILVSILYCLPAMQGKVLQQLDVSKFNGAIKNSQDYAKQHDGKYPLWTNSMFSGMPTFQIGGVGGSKILGTISTVLTLGLPKPASFFFLACICFYIFCCCLRISPWVGIAGSLAYAFATYNPIIISVGHDTKMMAIAYMPAVLGSIMLILNKKYWLGSVLSVLFIGLMLSANHLQIFYYLYIAIGIMCFYNLFYFIKNKEFKHLLISGTLILLTTALGIGCNAKLLMSTFEYQKETQRGGSSALTDSTGKEKSTTGLGKDYAFSYSMYKTEPMVMLFPRMFGGSSDKEEVASDKSKTIEALSNLPKELQQQLPTSYYWGGIGSTSGPPYVGAIICFLAILGMFVIDSKYKWWMLTTIILTVIMSWGSYFEAFNDFLYYHMPLYNKFRAPSMILVIPELLISILAVFSLNNIIHSTDKKSLLEKLKKGVIATGVIFLIAFVCYFSFDYMGESTNGLLKQVKQMNQQQLTDYVKEFVNGLVSDRKSLFLTDIFRSLLFVVIAAGFIYASVKNWIKPMLVALGIALFAFIDLALVNHKYLNAENYQDKQDNETEYVATAKDNEILADKGNYRVFNMSGDRFAETATSYLYKSIGGYHSAKLSLYQDLYEKQLSNTPNQNVLNMLNAKYIIQKDRAEKTLQYQKNDGTLGNVWFVQNVEFVKNADAEMAALNNFNPKVTAIMQENFKPQITNTIESDTTSTIQLIKNDNDYIEYAANNNKNQLAVFSEIYYKSGWKAFVDNKEQPILKVNYVLRALLLAPGKHKIEFKFEPEGYTKGTNIANISNIILALLLLSLIVILYLNYKKNNLHLNAGVKN